MIRQIFFIISAALITCSMAQGGKPESIYLDKFLEQCKRGKASYTMEVVGHTDSAIQVEVRNMKGVLKMKGAYTDEALTTEHGEFTYYYPNGKIESRGRYTLGSKSGLWLRFHQNGQPKAERLYDNEVLATVVYTRAEKMPKYPGGETAMNRYFSDHLRSVSHEGGNMKTSFIVETDGDLSAVQILEGVNDEVDAAAVRILGDMPSWEPGMDKGRAVRVQMVLPVEF